MPIPSVFTVFPLLRVPDMSVSSVFPAPPNSQFSHLPKPQFCGVSAAVGAETIGIFSVSVIPTPCREHQYSLYSDPIARAPCPNPIPLPEHPCPNSIPVPAHPCPNRNNVHSDPIPVPELSLHLFLMHLLTAVTIISTISREHDPRHHRHHHPDLPALLHPCLCFPLHRHFLARHLDSAKFVFCLAKNLSHAGQAKRHNTSNKHMLVKLASTTVPQ